MGVRALWPRGLPARLAVAAFAAAALLYVAAIAVCGGSVPGLLLYTAAFAALVYLPGLWLSNVLLPGLSRSSKPAVAVALGAGFLALCYAALGALWMPAVFVAPLAATALWAAGLINRRKLPRGLAPLKPQAYGWLFAFGAAVFLCVFWGVFGSAWPSAVGGMQYNQDALWGAGSAAGVWYGFPVRDLRTAGGIFHYHYFSDAVAGLVAVFSGQHTWDANFFFLRPVWLGLMMLGGYSAARAMGAGPWGALVCPAGISLGAFTSHLAATHTYGNPNNVTQSYVFILATALVLQHALRGGAAPKRSVPAIALSLAVLVWSKGSVGVLFIIGFAAGWLVWALLHRRADGWLALGVGLGGLAALVLTRALFSGAHINLYFSFSLRRTGEVLRSVLWPNAPIVLLYLISLLYTIRRFFAMTFMELSLNAVVFGGIMANCLFDHYGGAETYFKLASVFVMWLCLSPVLPVLLGKKPGIALVGGACAVAVAGNMLTAAPALRHGVQAALRCVGLRPAFDRHYDTVTPDDEAAALWLRANMGENEVFATNRNERSLDSKDGVFHAYTALSGRQAYVEGWFYAMEYSMEYHRLRHNLETVSDGLFACESYGEAAAIARENGIGYLLLHLPTGGAAFAGGQPVFTSDTVLIYTVNPGEKADGHGRTAVET